MNCPQVRIFVVILKLICILHLSVSNFATYSTLNSPKVVWIQEDYNLAQFDSYTKNATYYVTKSDFRLGCDPSKPTRWMITLRDDGDAVSRIKVNITKERLGRDSEGKKDKFLSELQVSLKDSETLLTQANFSCSFVSNESISQYDFVTCITFDRPLNGSKPYVQIRENLIRKYCNTIYHSTTLNRPCALNLTVDMKNALGTCGNPRHDIKTQACENLDSCESIVEKEMWNMKNCTGKLQNLAGSSNVKKIRNDSTLTVVHCTNLSELLEWTAILFPYPTFDPESWSQFQYYEKMNDALNANSTVLYALYPDEIYSNVKIKPIQDLAVGRRVDFAHGETVQFVCIGIEYLYMKGFQFKIEGDFWEEVYNGTRHYELDSKRHITRINKTLDFNEYREKNFSISCRGPIWNSDEWKESTLEFTISDPEKPYVYLKKDKDTVVINGQESLKLTCSYGGWPRPTVSWKSSVGLIETDDSELHIQNRSSHIQKPHHWYQTRYARKSSSYSITCEVENFLDKRSATVEFESKFVLIIISCVAIIIWISLTVIGIMYARYRKKLALYSQVKTLTMKEIDEFYSGVSIKAAVDCEALLLPYDEEYEIPRDQFFLDGGILGSGQFGIVLKGTIGPMPVAVKTIKPSSDVTHLKSLLSELKILQFVGPHRNIVNLIGANTENIKKGEIFLILDFCANGNLINLLRQGRDTFIDFFKSTEGNQYDRREFPHYHNSRSFVLTTGNLINFSHEIACAMDHLSSKNVIHGDLAARNVLITEDLQAKICDFGLSKQLQHYSVYVQKIDCPLPLRWMAIESLADMEFSLASDVWSFGIVLYEIFSLGELPYPGVQWGFESYKMLSDGYRMAMPDYSNASIYRLMDQCWSAQPQERPSFKYIMQQLKKEEELLT